MHDWASSRASSCRRQSSFAFSKSYFLFSKSLYPLQTFLLLQQRLFFFDDQIDRGPVASDQSINLIDPPLCMVSSAQGLALGQLLSRDSAHSVPLSPGDPALFLAAQGMFLAQ